MNGFALFANFENPFGDTRRAFHESVATVVMAEHLDFDQVWLTEHHFNAFSVSASIFPLLAHLAGRTRRIGLGAAAVLLPFHDPVRVAEDAATVDALSNGRLLLGIAKGGPFPDQFRHFHVSHDESRQRMFESLDLLEQIFSGESVSYQSEHFSYENLSVFPRPIRPTLPIWLASVAPESLAQAAARGYGLMGPSAAPIGKIKTVLNDFGALKPLASPPFVLARYLMCHRDAERARREALPFMRDFGKNMRAAIRQVPSAKGAITPFGQTEADFAEQSLLDNAIVGDPAQCIDQCIEIQEKLGDVVLLLKPAAYDPELTRDSLTLFAERVRPFLPETPIVKSELSPGANLRLPDLPCGVNGQFCPHG